MNGLFENHMARLNITWAQQNADLPDPIGVDLDDASVKAQATEAVIAGLPGIDADPNVNFADFVVDRFPAKGELPARILLRPKTAFGR
jgi:hypothetical protein